MRFGDWPFTSCCGCVQKRSSHASFQWVTRTILWTRCSADSPWLSSLTTFLVLKIWLKFAGELTKREHAIVENHQDGKSIRKTWRTKVDASASTFKSISSIWMTWLAGVRSCCFILRPTSTAPRNPDAFELSGDKTGLFVTIIAHNSKWTGVTST